MTGNAGETFQVPPELRAFAEKSLEQARQTFDSFVAAAHGTVSAFEGQADSARKGALEVGERTMAFAQRNIASSFEFAQKLVRAKDVAEMLKLQNEYMQAQMQVLSEQTKELGETTSRMAKDAGSPR